MQTRTAVSRRSGAAAAVACQRWTMLPLTRQTLHHRLWMLMLQLLSLLRSPCSSCGRLSGLPSLQLNWVPQVRAETSLEAKSKEQWSLQGDIASAVAAGSGKSNRDPEKNDLQPTRHMEVFRSQRPHPVRSLVCWHVHCASLARCRCSSDKP